MHGLSRSGGGVLVFYSLYVHTQKEKKKRVVICAVILLVIFLVTPSKPHFPCFAEAIVVFISCYAHTQREAAFFYFFFSYSVPLFLLTPFKQFHDCIPWLA